MACLLHFCARLHLDFLTNCLNSSYIAVTPRQIARKSNLRVMFSLDVFFYEVDQVYSDAEEVEDKDAKEVFQVEPVGLLLAVASDQGLNGRHQSVKQVHALHLQKESETIA